MCDDDYYRGSDYFYGFNIARVMFSDQHRVNRLENNVAELEAEIEKLERHFREGYEQFLQLKATNRANIKMGQLLMEELRHYAPTHPLLNDELRKSKGREFRQEELEKLFAAHKK